MNYLKLALGLGIGVGLVVAGIYDDRKTKKEYAKAQKKIDDIMEKEMEAHESFRKDLEDFGKKLEEAKRILKNRKAG